MKFKTSFFTACLVCTKARRTPFPVREYSLINKSIYARACYCSCSYNFNTAPNRVRLLMNFCNSIIKVGVVKEPTF